MNILLIAMNGRASSAINQSSTLISRSSNLIAFDIKSSVNVAISKNPKTVQANTVANEMFLDIANSVAEVIVERAGSEAEPPKIQRILVESSQ